MINFPFCLDTIYYIKVVTYVLTYIHFIIVYMTAIDGNFMLEHNYIRKVTLQKSQNGIKYEVYESSLFCIEFIPGVFYFDNLHICCNKGWNVGFNWSIF